jgi:glycosyltransferase involved in cell wall biosynthesis
VLEAMACGTPVVTTGYLPADPTNTWLVPVADSSAIACAVEAIISEPRGERALRLDRAAQATTRFHWDRVGAEMLAIFRSETSAR